LQQFPKIIYSGEIEPGDLEQLTSSGIALVPVQVDIARTVEVHFIDLATFSSSLENTAKMEIPCFYKENVIVLNSLTFDKIESAVKYLYDKGYFEFDRRRNAREISNPVSS
jgi:hypothetical protein